MAIKKVKEGERVLEFDWLPELIDLIVQVKDVREKVFHVIDCIEQGKSTQQKEDLREAMGRWCNHLSRATRYLVEAIEEMEEVKVDADHFSRYGY